MTSTVIWKFSLLVEDEFSIRMPSTHRILCVQEQRGEICLWAEVDPESPLVPKTFYIYGTGYPIAKSMGRLHLEARYIGSVQVGILVWHVYEKCAEMPK